MRVERENWGDGTYQLGETGEERSTRGVGEEGEEACDKSERLKQRRLGGGELLSAYALYQLLDFGKLGTNGGVDEALCERLSVEKGRAEVVGDEHATESRGVAGEATQVAS